MNKVLLLFKKNIIIIIINFFIFYLRKGLSKNFKLTDVFTLTIFYQLLRTVRSTNSKRVGCIKEVFSADDIKKINK